MNGQLLPATDSLGFARVFGGAIELYRADSLRVIHVSRDLIHDRLPCEALRVMAAAKGTGGLGAVSDTSTAGCDELRGTETDTHVVAYAREGDRLRVPDATVRIHGDTLIFEDEVRDVTIGGATTIRTRSQRYVRVATPTPSREPQN